MDKLIAYICDELEELERKADKEGKLSMSEIQYVDVLAHAKKNLLKGEEMYDEMESNYSRRSNRSNRSNEGSYRGEGESYARGRGRNARRDSRGRYSRESGYSREYSMAGDDMMDELHEMLENASDEQSREEIRRFIKKMEQMR